MNIFRENLKELSIIRFFLLAILWMSWLASWRIEEVEHTDIGFLLGFLSAVALLSFNRLRYLTAVTELEFFVQLLIDVLGFILLFYFSGGASNPFVSYLLVPVCLAAASLQWRYTMIISLLSVFLYSLLLFFFHKLSLFSPEHQLQHEHPPQTWSWHILGMWLNFFISAGLITFFLTRMARRLKQQTELIQSLREDELRNQYLLSVALQAAGAAHELNTPLSTIKVLVSDVLQDLKKSRNQALKKDLSIIEHQIDQCAQILKHMVQSATSVSSNETEPQSIKDFCYSVIDKWQLLRPQVQYQLNFPGADLAESDFQKKIQWPIQISHALINVLNNAADAADSPVQIKLFFQDKNLCWEISDQGRGIAPQLKSTLGKISQTSKEDGLGVGLVLTHASIKSIGGRITQDSTEFGTCTLVSIPT